MAQTMEHPFHSFSELFK